MRQALPTSLDGYALHCMTMQATISHPRSRNHKRTSAGFSPDQPDIGLIRHTYGHNRVALGEDRAPWRRSAGPAGAERHAPHAGRTLAAGRLGLEVDELRARPCPDALDRGMSSQASPGGGGGRLEIAGIPCDGPTGVFAR